MKKSISISIRVSEEELDKFKQAAKLEAYASYSEFVRRTALMWQYQDRIVLEKVVYWKAIRKIVKIRNFFIFHWRILGWSQKKKKV